MIDGAAVFDDTVALVSGSIVLAGGIAAHVTSGQTRLEVVSGGQLVTMGDMQAMISGSVPVELLHAATGIRWHGVVLDWSVGTKPAPVRAHGALIYYRCALTKTGASWVPEVD